MRLILDNGGKAEITPEAYALLDAGSMCKNDNLHYRATVTDRKGKVGIIAKGNTPNEVAESLVKQLNKVLDNSQTSGVE